MKNQIKQGLLLLVFAMLFVGCKKDDDKYPSIQTTTVAITSPGKVLFTGNLVSAGKFKVVDYGFIYSTSPIFDVNTATKVSLGNSPSEGKFEKEASVYVNNQYYNNQIYAKAYLTNEQGTAYGSVISLTLPINTTSNISPTSGFAGDLINVYGQFFTDNVNNISVFFGGIRATIKEFSPSKLVVEVPAGVNSQNYSNNIVLINITVNNSQVANSYQFTILPTAKSFAPTTGLIGSYISIAGNNFPTSSYSNSLRLRLLLGTKEITNFYYSSTELRAYIPEDIGTEKFTVTLIVDGVSKVLPGEFTLISPSISSFSPTNGLPGTLVTVYGSNLPLTNYYSTYGKINMGGINVNVSSLNSNSFQFTVPSSLAEGDYDVQMNAGPFVVKAAQKFKVTAPNITSFSPASGTVGQQVIISGAFQTGIYYTVNIGGINNSYYSSSSNQLVVTVPSGAALGDAKITITSGGLSATSRDNFKVVGPEITSFSPTSGVAGTVVTINGTGFNSSYTYNNTVKFGTVSTAILTATSNRITVAVPSNITPSAMKISVTVNGQTITSTDNFTITN